MKMMITAVTMAICLCSGIALASNRCCGDRQGGAGEKTAAVVADTTQSAASGTAQVVQSSVRDTVETPKIAVQAVKDTAGTALHRADAAIRAFTGDED